MKNSQLLHRSSISTIYRGYMAQSDATTKQDNDPREQGEE